MLTADLIVINTGARPAKPPINGLTKVDTLDSTSALKLSEVPDHLAVVGAGYVGMEYAQMYRRFGADVTVFQRPECVLPREDPEVSQALEEVFESEGIDVWTDTSVEQLTEADGKIEVRAEANGETTTVDASEVLIAAGRQPNTDRIGLDQTDVVTDDKGFIEVDEQFQTAEDRIWAMGDVTGMPMFTHSARDDATLLYRHLVKDEEINADDRHVPRAVFTDPSVGRVGMTEKQARNHGHDVTIGRSEYSEQGKPKALGETEGFVKIVSDADTKRILGCHIVGEDGAEIIHEVVMAMELGGTADEIADAIHIHPTLSEVVNSAAGGVHKPS